MTPRREALAQIPPEALQHALEWVRLHGALTEPMLARAVRDSAILRDLGKDNQPGRYARVAARWGVHEDTVRSVESIFLRMSKSN